MLAYGKTAKVMIYLSIGLSASAESTTMPAYSTLVHQSQTNDKMIWPALNVTASIEIKSRGKYFIISKLIIYSND